MEKDLFLEGLKEVSSFKETENGAFALNSTGEALLNAFGTLGAMRRRDNSDIINTFMKAYGEDRLFAMKMLFYLRDARGGLGEREAFKIIANYLAKSHRDDIGVNLSLVPEFGRWDDLYAFVGTDLEDAAFELMHKQFDADMKALKEKKPVSVLGKWLKSCNTSAKESRILGRLTAKKFGLSEAEYRHNLSALRKAIDVTEVKMSANEWGNIKYEAVPSYAAKNYRDAFLKHDKDGYEDYLSKVSKGEAKINSKTLFPYDIVREYGYRYCGHHRMNGGKVDETLELQWKSLPNYVTDGKKFLVMADTSGSMIGLPMETSVSLAIYFAERNTGAYHGKFITFTDNPRLIDIPDTLNLRDKINLVLDDKYVGYNTNLEAAFQLVLDSAIRTKCSQEDLPEAILVISDMEIDDFGRGEANMTFTSEMSKRFANAGYKMPVLVYWNVSARHDTFHANASDDVRFVSGSSATIFKGLCENLGYSAMELMLSTLNAERYSSVKISE